MQKLRILNKKEIQKVLDKLKKQFGFKGELNYAFLLSEKNKLYIVNKDIEKIDLSKLRVNSYGLYIAEVRDGKIRLSMDGSQVIGKEATKNVVDAIKTIINGELYLNKKISITIIDRMINKSSESLNTPVNSLSNRELEVFQLIGNGYSTKDIAQYMNISTNTVESFRRNIKEKMNLKGAAELTKNAIQWVMVNSTQQR